MLRLLLPVSCQPLPPFFLPRLNLCLVPRLDMIVNELRHFLLGESPSGGHGMFGCRLRLFRLRHDPPVIGPAKPQAGGPAAVPSVCRAGSYPASIIVMIRFCVCEASRQDQRPLWPSRWRREQVRLGRAGSQQGHPPRGLTLPCTRSECGYCCPHTRAPRGAIPSRRSTRSIHDSPEKVKGTAV